MTAQNFSPKRSLLYMPASNPKLLEKAKSLDVDIIGFDLEDAVAPEAKPQAREGIIAALNAGGYGNREIIVRTNAIDTEYFEDDIKAVVASGAKAILIPKISYKADLIKVDEIVKSHNGGKSLEIWAMIETAMAIVNIADICSSALIIPFRGVVMGTNDLAKETGAVLDAERMPFLFALSATLNAARAYGIAAIDGVHNDIADIAGLEYQAIQAKKIGYDGKSIIHPSQIDIVNQVFSPSEGEIAEASAIVDAFNLPENAGKGAIKVNGKMAEFLHRDMALKTLAIAKRIQTIKT